jgi:hypothetical protein
LVCTLVVVRWLLTILLVIVPLGVQAAEWAPPQNDPVQAGPPPLQEGWSSTTGVYARVHSSPEHLSTQIRLSRHAEEAIPRIARVLGLPAARRIEVILTGSDDEFRSLQPRPPPLWADATAWPRRSWIFLRTNRVRGGTARPDTQVFDHEITHILLGQSFGNRTPPAWLQEGLSQWIAGEYTPETTRQIAAGLLGKGLHSLESLQTGFPNDPVQARLAYAQSADLIAWIAAEHGEEAIRTLVISMAGGSPFEASIKRATGKRMSAIDRAWRSRLEDSWLWVHSLTVDTFLMSLGAVLLVVAFFAVRFRNRRKLALWKEQEALEDALYSLLMHPVDTPSSPSDPTPRTPTWH